MRPRTLLVLSLLVAAMAAFVWFVERDLPGSDERVERARLVLDFDPDLVTELRWRRGESAVELVRDSADDGGRWRLLAPLSARADLAAVDSLLATLAALEKQRTIEDADPEQLALTPPRAELTVATADGEQRLLVGGAVPASSSMIVATAATGPFYVVDGTVWNELEKAAGDWRSRDVFPQSRLEIESVLIERGAVVGDAGDLMKGAGERIVLSRRDDGFWLEQPLVDRADEGTISRLLDALVALEVDEFFDGEEPGAGFDSPALRLEVKTSDGAEWSIELGAELPPAIAEGPVRRVVRAEGQLFAISDALDRSLATPADEWRSLEWTTVETFEIEQLAVEGAGGALELKREAGEWLRDGEAIGFNVVNDLLYALTGSRAEALDSAAVAAGDPQLVVTLNSGPEEQRLELFATDGSDRHPATTSGRDIALWLGGDLVRDVLAKVALVRAAEVVSDDPAAAPEAVTPAIDSALGQSPE